MAVPVIDAGCARPLLPMRAAIDALEAGFGAEHLPEAPLRTHVETQAGTLLLMPAHGRAGVGVKLVTLTRGEPGARPPVHPRASTCCSMPTTQAPAAMIDGAALTALRTAAVSGLATRFLAREDARRLVLYGAGVQARSHLEAMRAVRPIEEVVVVSRSPGPRRGTRAEASAAGWRRASGNREPSATPTSCAPARRARPRWSVGDALPAGVHVNAVGAYLPSMREVDTDGVRRARVVVETREAALAEAGEL